MESFSKRHGLEQADAEITVRHEAPDWLLSVSIDYAYIAGLRPNQLRSHLCDVLYESPDPQNWSEFPNVDEEARYLLRKAPWYITYDFIEWVFACRQSAARYNQPQISDSLAIEFSEKINRAFRVKGVGWQLVEGQIQVRGPEIFEEVVHTAINLTDRSNRVVAKNELSEALKDLSRRPMPEITGAIQHSMAALECIARAVTNDQKLTLGEWIKQNRGILPPPVDQAVDKLWGYASEFGRHLKEGKPARYEEAELVVGLAGAISVYLLRKSESSAQPNTLVTPPF